MKEHMAKMRAKSAETRARKKAEKEALKKGKPPAQTPPPARPPTPNVETPQYSQPVDATALQQKLAELEKQNKAYKDWYQQNKHHLNNIPAKPKPSEPIPVPQTQGQVMYDNRHNMNMSQGLDRLSHLEAMIRKDEREKLLAKQKQEREEQAKNLANARNKMPVGLRKWQNLPAQQHYANNVDMWSKCFDPVREGLRSVRCLCHRLVYVRGGLIPRGSSRRDQELEKKNLPQQGVVLTSRGLRASSGEGR